MRLSHVIPWLHGGRELGPNPCILEHWGHGMVLFVSCGRPLMVPLHSTIAKAFRQKAHSQSHRMRPQLIQNQSRTQNSVPNISSDHLYWPLCSPFCATKSAVAIRKKIAWCECTFSLIESFSSSSCSSSSASAGPKWRRNAIQPEDLPECTGNLPGQRQAPSRTANVRSVHDRETDYKT